MNALLVTIPSALTSPVVLIAMRLIGSKSWSTAPVVDTTTFLSSPTRPLRSAIGANGRAAIRGWGSSSTTATLTLEPPMSNARVRSLTTASDGGGDLREAGWRIRIEPTVAGESECQLLSAHGRGNRCERFGHPGRNWKVSARQVGDREHVATARADVARDLSHVRRAGPSRRDRQHREIRVHHRDRPVTEVGGRVRPREQRGRLLELQRSLESDAEQEPAGEDDGGARIAYLGRDPTRRRWIGEHRLH